MTLAPPAAAEKQDATTTSPTEEQAPRVEQDDEPPATSRSSELVTARTRSARDRLEKVLDRIEDLLDELDGNDVEVSASQRLLVLRALVSPIRLLGHFTGEVGASDTTVAASPFYRRVRAAIVEALRPKEHRAAAEAVLAALDRLEGGQREHTESAAE